MEKFEEFELNEELPKVPEMLLLEDKWGMGRKMEIHKNPDSSQKSLFL